MKNGVAGDYSQHSGGADAAYRRLLFGCDDFLADNGVSSGTSPDVGFDSSIWLIAVLASQCDARQPMRCVVQARVTVQHYSVVVADTFYRLLHILVVPILFVLFPINLMNLFIARMLRPINIATDLV